MLQRSILLIENLKNILEELRRSEIEIIFNVAPLEL